MRLKIEDSSGAKDKLVLSKARKAVIGFKGGQNRPTPGEKYEGAVEVEVDGFLKKTYDFSVRAQVGDSMLDVMERARQELLTQMVDDPDAPGVLLERRPPPYLVFMFAKHISEAGVSSSTTDETISGPQSYAILDSTIPEPQAIVLSGIGLAGLLIAGRRRLNKGAQSAA